MTPMASESVYMYARRIEASLVWAYFAFVISLIVTNKQKVCDITH
jgi:hypothetical protein